MFLGVSTQNSGLLSRSPARQWNMPYSQRIWTTQSKVSRIPGHTIVTFEDCGQPLLSISQRAADKAAPQRIRLPIPRIPTLPFPPGVSRDQTTDLSPIHAHDSLYIDGSSTSRTLRRRMSLFIFRSFRITALLSQLRARLSRAP